MSDVGPTGTATPDEAPRIARCLVHVTNDHLDRAFDYVIPDDLAGDLHPGQLVEVPFAGRRVRAVVHEVVRGSSVPGAKLRPIARRLGPHVWLDSDDRDLLRWAADRFASTVGATLSHALPKRTIDVERRAEAAGWFPPGAAERPADPSPPDSTGWSGYGASGTELLDAAVNGSGAFFWRPVPGERLGTRLAELVGLTLAGGRDVLLLTPDPASEAIDEVVARYADVAVDLRGGPSPRVVYRDWLRARCGQARVVVGERGSAFVPLERLGLAIAIDEANPALKERRAPRHHAREVILERARRAGGVGLLVGTVPSAQAWGLMTQHRIAPVTASRPDERAAAPLIEVSDGGTGPRTRIHQRSFRALRAAAAAGTYGIVLAARRGEGRALACGSCGERFACPTCASSVDPADGGLVVCEGCGWRAARRPTCRRCGKERFVPLAAGAERIAAELRRGLPDVTVAVLEGYAAAAPPPPAILVMTRGSVLEHPPGPVGAVVLPDVDGLLRRATLDAAEDALRLSMQLARWAVHVPAEGDPMSTGRRREVPVVVQTREPEHHVIQALLRWDPGGFWRGERERRAELLWPPVAAAIRLDVPGDGMALYDELSAAVPVGDVVLGPVPRRGRAAYLIKSMDRVRTVAALAPIRESWSRASGDLRVDVDPVDVT